MLEQIGPQLLTQRRIIGQLLGEDIAGPSQGVARRLDAFFCVAVRGCQSLRCRVLQILLQQPRGKRRQALLPGSRRPGPALGPVGAVEILDLRQCHGSIQRCLQLGRQLFLLSHGLFDFLPALRQMAQILQPLGKLPQCGIVHPAVLLFPIAGNKGDRIARIEQVDDVLYVSFRLAQLRRQGLCDLQVLSLLCLSVCTAWASA